jgi:biotin carboxylase
VKKIMFLGGSHFQLPAIKYAKNAGYHVTTVDYKPSNPGHKIANEYHNISTIKKKKVLEIASSIGIDGISAYASDPGAPTAAYVSEKLNLSGHSYNAVRNFQKKDLFRKFLKEEGFNVPQSKAFKDHSEAKKYAKKLIKKHNIIIIKPVDSSGSKGVSKLESAGSFERAFGTAKEFSLTDKVVVEQFIRSTVYQMDGDGFVSGGELSFFCFGNQHNDDDCNPHAPVGISFPYIVKPKIKKRAQREIERAISLSGLKTGGVNIEFLVGKNDQVYILEIGPRPGGNRIPEVIKYHTEVDLVKKSVEASLGNTYISEQKDREDQYHAVYIIHSKKDGIFSKIDIHKKIKESILDINIWTEKGEKIEKFSGSHNTLGSVIMKFDSEREMIAKMENMDEYIKVKTR